MFARFIPLAAALFVFATAVCTAPVSAEVLLNEMLADPARDWNGDATINSRDDEWAEIINTGPGTADLTGFRLAGTDSVWRYEFTGTLAPGAVRVVYGRQSYDWEVANGFPAFGLRLGNSGGELVLFKVAGASVTQIDCYAYSDHEADDDRSSGRGPDGGPNWILLDGHNPWTGAALPKGSGCFPTPGAKLTCATPVEPVTWGRVKALIDLER